MENIGMQQIIERLEEWQANIGCDIQKEEEWETPSFERFKQREQWLMLNKAIMNLKSIGPNNNITE